MKKEEFINYLLQDIKLYKMQDSSKEEYQLFNDSLVTNSNLLLERIKNTPVLSEKANNFRIYVIFSFQDNKLLPESLKEDFRQLLTGEQLNVKHKTNLSITRFLNVLSLSELKEEIGLEIMEERDNILYFTTNNPNARITKFSCSADITNFSNQLATFKRKLKWQMC